MKACFAEQMRNVDRAAEEIGGIPSIVLMENAALSCVYELEKFKSVAVFCGKGNNGGDGFAIARHLFNRGVEVSVFLVCGNEFKGDAKINYNIIAGMDIPIETITDTDGLKYIIKSFDCVVDAIYGTGIHGVVRGISGDVIREINNNAKYILSVDIPSGINSDSGEICGVCIKADKTVTFAAYKVGMLMYPGADFTGEVVVSDISIPKYIIDSCGIKINIIDDKFIRDNFPKRENNSQKGDYGKVFIIAGSTGMSGAAYMAAQSAVRGGSGLVTLAVPECINQIMETKTTEAMTIPFCCKDGHFSAEAAEEIVKRANSCDAVLIGPGIGRSDDIRCILEQILLKSHVPVIVDADGINVLSQNKDMISQCACDLIFTPHAVEMARLTGFDVSYIEDNRLVVSKEFCEENGAALILKGHHTIVTAPDGVQYINITGNSGMATGGSGDVLAGLVASFTARGIDEAPAAAMAAYIHGRAGDIAAKEKGKDSLLATDILRCIPKAMSQILQVDF